MIETLTAAALALHYASSTPSPTVLEHILSHPKCDVDPQNRLERSTPLHLAVKIDDDDLRLHVVQSLLEAGANTKSGLPTHLPQNIWLIKYDSFRIQDKYKSIPIDLVPSRDNETRAAIRRAEADTFNINQDDIADGLTLFRRMSSPRILTFPPSDDDEPDSDEVPSDED
jgi:hypothetical protein